MEKELIFKKITGDMVENVEKYVKDWAIENPYGTVTIGCDSQMHGRRIKYSIVICMHYIDRVGQGHGAHVIYCDIWEKRINKSPAEEMPSKLWKEAEYVLRAAEMVDGKDEVFKKKITVHLDYSDEPLRKSNMMYAAGIGYITGMGYKAEGKPFAWAATHTADHLCR
jgi:predicted RNase H-related nuclease YkuK (DUF458 family)